MLYELLFLAKAFPQGQRNDPPIPTKVSSSGLFTAILPKYFFGLILVIYKPRSNRFMLLIRMLEKDCLVRIKSRRLLSELENLYDEVNQSIREEY